MALWLGRGLQQEAARLQENSRQKQATLPNVAKVTQAVHLLSLDTDASLYPTCMYILHPSSAALICIARSSGCIIYL